MGRLRVTLISLLLACFALTGCFGDDGTDNPDPTDHDDHDDGNQTDDGDQTDENATVDRSLTFEGSIDEGNVPLVVNFTLNSTDADNVTAWTLDFGDNSTAEQGDALPADASHTYEVEGNYTATFTVEYADNATENATLLVVAVAGSGGGTEGPSDIHIDYAGTALVPVPAGLGSITGEDTPDGFCDMDDYARDNDANETFIVYFDLEVQEGATRVYIEGGAPEAVPLDVTSSPDFDVFVETPDGSCFVNDGPSVSPSYEATSVKDGLTAGTYVAALIYWAGPPAEDYDGFVEVNYGSFIERQPAE